MATVVHDNECACGCGDDFRPVSGPSLATLFSRWLDRGLPTRTWSDFVRRFKAEQCEHVNAVEVELSDCRTSRTR